MAHDEESGRTAARLDKAALALPTFFSRSFCSQHGQDQSQSETRKLTFADAALTVLFAL